MHGLDPAERLEVVEQLTRAAKGPDLAEPGAERQALLEAHRRLAERHAFSIGELVRWKPGLRNRPLPECEQLAIVLEVLERPVENAGEPTESPYFREPLDLVLGVIDGDGDLAAFHFDGRRFEPAGESGYPPRRPPRKVCIRDRDSHRCYRT